jgi:O-antigen/teichoic acid export membrane protein
LPLTSNRRPRGRRRVAQRAEATLLVFGAGQLVTAAAFVITARRAAPSDFGAFSILYSLTIGLSGLLDFGSSARWTRDFARGQSLETFRSWLYRRTAIEVAPAALLVFVSTSFWADRLGLACIVGLCSQVVLWSAAQGALAPVRARSAASAALLVLVGNILLLLAAATAPTRTLFTAVGLAAGASWLVTALMAGRRWPASTRRRYSGSVWRGASGFGLQSVATSMQSFDVVVLGALLGSSAAADLAAVARWNQPFVLAASAFAAHLLPSMAAASSARRAASHLREIVAPTIVLGAVACIVAAFGQVIVGSVLGPAYEDAGVLFQLSIVAILPVFVNQPLAMFLQARGFERVPAVVSVSAVIGALMTIVATAHLLGSAAAPIAALASQLVVAFVVIRATRRVVAASDGPCDRSAPV